MTAEQAAGARHGDSPGDSDGAGDLRHNAPVVAAVVPIAPTPLRPLSAVDVRLTGGFWAERAAANRRRTIPAGFEQLREVGTLHNFRLAAQAARDGYRALGLMFDKPFPFLDSDVYKWLEAAGWELGHGPDPRIAAMADEAIELVTAAQRADGYLNTFVQVLTPGAQYQDLAWGHELYCYGHLIQAAVAWSRALGDDRLLRVAERAVASVERELGPNGRDAIEGHPEIEMALVELYRLTGAARHLDLAALLIDRRGRGTLGSGRHGRAYWQDHLPVREAPTAAGHAVRQLYLDCGVVDVAVERGDVALLEAVRRRWRAMVESQMYLTGALGSRHRDEAFGDPFELPPDRAYAETCAAIASAMLAWRLLLATGDPACADVLERTVYNGILPSLSKDATEFFYVNPLQRRTHRIWTEPGAADRAPWYACACCPPNLMRLISSWPQQLATADGEGIQLQQYASADLKAAVEGGTVGLAVETGYPWTGDVSVRIAETPGAPWTLTLRVPAWSEGATATVGDEAAASVTGDSGRAIELRRTWRAGDTVSLRLAMPPRVTRPDPRVDATRGTVALERGPLVYAFETADLPPGAELEGLAVDIGTTLVDEPRADLGTDVVGLRVGGRLDGAPVDARAIPYFAWANRGAGGMRVWVPESKA